MIRDWDSYVFLPRERVVADALARTLYASSDPRSSSEKVIFDALAAAEAWLAAPSPLLRGALRVLLLQLELSPIRYGFGPRTMSGLSSSARLDYLRALDDAGSAALDAWKSILGMAYFGRRHGIEHMDLRLQRLRLVRGPQVAARSISRDGHVADVERIAS